LISQVLGGATGWIPFSVFEVLLACAVLAAFWACSRNVHLLMVRQRRLRNVALRALLSVLALAGLVYGGGMLVWGIAYHRTSLAERAGWDARPPTPEELRALCLELANAANVTRREVGEDGTGVMRLEGAQRRALSRAHLGFDRASQVHEFLAQGYAGRAKGSYVLSAAMSQLGLGGVFIPHTGEPTVNLELPDPALPAAACHEIAHQMGFAREDEASIVGYLGCTTHPDPEFRYSGYLSALGNSLWALERADPATFRTIGDLVDPAVQRDRLAVYAFWARHESSVTRVGLRVNDLYLKSQGQVAGVRSYGRVVELLVAERREREPGASTPSSFRRLLFSTRPPRATGRADEGT